jgi:aryl-alcohol dehydrogenase-like predicted oxidoreductase
MSRAGGVHVSLCRGVEPLDLDTPLLARPRPRSTPRAAPQGLTKTVGVSNFNADRVKKAAQVLKGRGTSLSSNQVQYSLLYRKPEQNGGALYLLPRRPRARHAARGWTGDLAGGGPGRALPPAARRAGRAGKPRAPPPGAPRPPPVLEACKENGVTLVAYSPLCQGLLTGEGSRRLGTRRGSACELEPKAGASQFHAIHSMHTGALA